MARGGRRQGTPGRNYSNRRDLAVDRAPMPGSSANPPPVAPVQQQPQEQQQQPRITPDAIPTLDSPTMYPGRPVTTGLPTGPGAGPDPASEYRIDNRYNLLRAAARRDPANPDLRRVMAYLAARGDSNA